MDKDRLLDAHRAVNRLLGKLALGMERDSLNREVIELSEHLFGKRQASILRLHPDTNTLHLEFAPHCLLYTSPSPRDRYISRMPSSA